MMESILMNILTCRCERIGPPDGFEWLQNKISVPYWRVYWNREAGAFISEKSNEIELTPDFVVAIPPRTVYSTRATRGVSHFYIHFTASEPFESITPGIRIIREERILDFARELARELGNATPVARTMLKIQRYLCEVLLSIPENELPGKMRIAPCVEKAMAVLNEKPGVSIEDLANELQISRNRLSRLFTHATGLSPKKFSRRKRLERASMLLHFSNMTIKQIAEETGFCDRYHFSRLFKREFSYGPAEFRRQMESQIPPAKPEA